MITNYQEKPLSEPVLITQRQLDFMKSRFGREVIDPLFFGRVGDDPKKIQADIDAADQAFARLIDEKFEVSNQYEGGF